MAYRVVYCSVSWQALYVLYALYINLEIQFKSNRTGPVHRPWAVVQASARASARESAHRLVAQLTRATVSGDKTPAYGFTGVRSFDLGCRHP